MRALAATLGLLLAVAAGTALSAAPRGAVRVRTVATPSGVQGSAGEGADVAISFRLSDRAARPADVELQYAVDVEWDGRIREREFRPAMESTVDPRTTRGSGGSALFASAKGRGAANVIVWRSRADLEDAAFVRRASRARLRGPDLGVRLRLRTVGEDGRRGSWVATRLLSVDDRRAPDVRIDGAYYGRVRYVESPAATEPVEVVVDVDWRAFDGDSEDADGDGVLGAGEDRDGDGTLDAPGVSVDFSYHEPTSDELSRALTDTAFDAAALEWTRCPAARLPSDFPAAATGASTPSAAGPAHVFEWQAKDVLWPPPIVIPEVPAPQRWIFLRADPVGAGGLRGPTRYLFAPIRTRPQ